jgi:alpha-glucosidase
MTKRKYRYSIFILVLLSFFNECLATDTLQVCSPSGKICLKTWMAKQLNYYISYDNKRILDISSIDLELENNMALAGGNSIQSSNSIRSSSVKQINEQIISLVPEKRKIIPDKYSLLTIQFKKSFKVEFRVYDDGVAYRISTSFKDSITIINEVAEFDFPGNDSAWFPMIKRRPDVDIFHTSFEEEYPLIRLDSIQNGVLSYSPVLVVPQIGPKIAITESDLYDYPGMFLGGTGTGKLKGVFAGYPLEERKTNELYSELLVTKRAPYIARTLGKRSFPWRVLIIAPEDKALPGNDLVYRLGASTIATDFSWVNPGNITDEWIIDINLFDVPFKAGLNTASYKYYIDFAKRFGFERIMMDAGWSDNNDLFKINPAISIDTLVAYAKEKGVKIAMWTLAMTLDRQLDSALDQFNKWGVDFIMTDFMNRDDQKMVNFYHRIAKACADHKIMIMFHGAFPPKGFNRTYPNAVAREGVLGSEFNIWSNRVTPGHDVTLAYTRMLAGSLDYEPGLLNNATEKGTRPVAGVVTSPGTRCHQLSMYVVYDSPMQFFSGNPSQGLKEPEFMELIGNLPTTWDETIILDGKVGEYIVTARKKDNNWFIASMTDWSPRDIKVKLDFLDIGNYKATICKDGVNADRYAADYDLKKNVPVKKGEELNIHLAPGGGFLIRIDRQ